MSEPRLTFDNGKFFFHDPLSAERTDKDSYWVFERNGIYSTTNLKAAAEFRRYSDIRTEKIFDRAFNKFYDAPLSPSLFSINFLDHHQKEGIAWVLTRKRSYLAHAPGAGKTAQAIIASLFSQGEGQTVFIVPPSLTLNWEREIWKFTEPLGNFPTIGIVPQSDNQDAMAWRSDFIICPDSMLTKNWVYDRLANLKIKFLGVDEASRFKDPTALRSLALYGGHTKDRKFKGLFQDAHHVVFMDGSPMPNRPMELWAPTIALAPETIDCMSREDFGFKYCGATQNNFGQWEFNHSSNEEILHSKLTRTFMHVVKEETLNHPERLRSLLYINKDVRSPDHKSWERQHLQNLKLSDIGESMNRGDIAHYRKELGIRKIPWIANYVADRLREKNDSILLFAWHREVCEGLVNALSKFKPLLVYGGTDNATRELFFKSFNSGEARLIIGNISSMGRGHNLQRANRIIFGEYSWTDELNKQCEKRSSRRGNEEEFIRCEYVVSPNSMDEIILNSVFTKAKRVERIVK